MTPSLLDRWTRGWRGPLLAALIALAAALPGALALPATDRSEARFAEATAEMLESGNLIDAADRAARPPRLGAHWVQAALAAVATDAESRRIWAFRLAALAGVALAAGACAWGGSALFGPSTGFLAGAIFAAAALPSTAGALDAPGSLLGAGVTLAVAALARLRLAAEGAFAAGTTTRVLFWLGVALAAVAGGPAGASVVVATGAVLWLADRRGAWIAGLGWGWGSILLAALIGPGLVAAAVGGQPWPIQAWLGAPAGGRTPGLHLLLSPLLLFPFALLLPAGLAAAMRARREAAVRVALCWLVPSWLAIEFLPGGAPSRTLVVQGAVAWLCALGARGRIGPLAARLGAGLQIACGAALVAGLLYAGERFGGAGALAWAAAAAALTAAAALAGAGLLVRGRTGAAVAFAGLTGLLAHDAAMAGLGPRLSELWVARRAAQGLAGAGLDPRGGVTPGPVAVAGYAEPSLAFALGGQMEAVSAEEAATAVRTGRPALVESREEEAFAAALGSRRAARRVGEVEGFDYVKGSTVRLAIYGPAR